MQVVNYWKEIFFAVICIYLLKFIKKRLEVARSLKDIPGPFALPIIGNTLQLLHGTTGFFKLSNKLAAEYKGRFTLWIGLNPLVMLSKAEDMQCVLSSKNIEKAEPYKYFTKWLGNGILLAKGQKWHNRRKLLTNSFHSEILGNFIEPAFNDCLIMINQLKKEVGGPSFDIMRYCKLCSLDIICDTAMGKQVHAQINSEGEIPVGIDRLSESVFMRFVTPWLRIKPFYNLSKYSKSEEKHLKVIHGFTDKIIKERRAEKLNSSKENNVHNEDDVKGKKRLAFLDLMLEMKENGASLPDVDVRDEVNTFTFGGFDTTGSSMAWTLYILGHHPEIQDKIAKEVEEIWGDPAYCPTMSDLGRLVYLDRCIKESMRMFPSVPTIGRKITENVELSNGIKLPAGVSCNFNFYMLHRDERYFPNPEKFDPDRFLPGVSSERHPYAYLPFSAGSRNCLGQRYAIMEMKIMLSCLIRNYVFHSIVKPSDLELYSELVLLNKSGVKVKITERK